MHDLAMSHDEKMELAAASLASLVSALLAAGTCHVCLRALLQIAAEEIEGAEASIERQPGSEGANN